MHCIVTAGPTYEPIDQVRRLTNHSTGQLGTGLAKRLADDGHEVTLLRGRSATHTEMPEGVGFQQFKTTADLAENLERLARAEPGAGAVFHAAAVSDFAVGQIFRRADDGQLKPLNAGKQPRLGAWPGSNADRRKPNQRLRRQRSRLWQRFRLAGQQRPSGAVGRPSGVVRQAGRLGQVAAISAASFPASLAVFG